LSATRNKIRFLALAAMLALSVGLRSSSAVESQVKPDAVESQVNPLRETVPTREQATFPHGKPKHRTLDCARCHKIEPGKIDETRFTGHASCIGCHNFAVEDIVRPVTFCGICHNGRAVSRQQSALFKYPKYAGSTDFGVAFSHPSHLKPRPYAGFDRASLTNPLLNLSVLGSGDPPRCDDCHKPIDPMQAKPAMRKPPEIDSATGHPSCFVCHGDRPLAKPSLSECAACHKLSGPRYPRLYGIVKDFKHPDHIYDTRPIIKAEVHFPRAPDYLCSECHQVAVKAVSLAEIKLPEQDYCNQCHNGRIGLPDPLSREVINSLRR